MLEQDRYGGAQRSRSLFREEGPAPGRGRFQVSGENDPAELRAESMADSVMGGGSLFRSPAGAGGGGFQADLDTADLGDAGESLPAGLQGSMERSFGTGFSGVRVHTGAGADRASRSISARAFTQGQDVYFRSGAYDPGSREGQHLIAHELAHVAAGDGGIHRAGGENAKPTTGMSKQDIWEMTMDVQATGCQGDLEQAGALIALGGDSRESVINQIRTGEVSVEGVRDRIGKVEQIEFRLGGWIGDMEKSTGDYLADIEERAESKEEAQKCADRSQNYSKAVKALALLKEAKQKLSEQIKPALQGVLGDMGQTTAGTDSAGFSETVANMLDDAACGQFFRAVEKVKKGRGGLSGDDFAALNSNAMRDAQNLHGDVVESGAEAVSRRAGNVGAAAGIGASLADTISGGAGIDEAANSENRHNQNAGTTGDSIGLAAGAVGLGADAVGMGADAKALHDQEAARRKKIQEMQQRNQDTGIGKASAANHTARAAVAGSAIGVLGDAAGVVSTSASLADDEDTSDIAGVTSASLGAAGDVFGLATDSQNAKERKDRDNEAKKNMRALGRQLRASITDGQTNEAELKAVCECLDGKRFNAGKKEDERLGNLITKALNGLENSRQKNLLATIQTLETGREANKGAMSDARKDALFSTIGLVGSLTSLAGSIASLAGSKLAGSILSMVGTVIGMVGMVRDAIGLGEKAADRQADRNSERDNKTAACQAAVGQMAALPALPLDILRLKRDKKLPLDEQQQTAAEQYASVFSIIKTSDVDMVDFLYAVEKGNFGGKDENGADMSAEASLKEMYANLSFS